jgi:hypothetical protein
VELIRTLDIVHSLPVAEVENVHRQVQDAILREASTGCRADELRELLGVIDTSDRIDPAVTAAQDGFANFKQHYFGEELRDCRSPEQFDDLIQDLHFFSRRTWR